MGNNTRKREWQDKDADHRKQCQKHPGERRGWDRKVIRKMRNEKSGEDIEERRKHRCGIKAGFQSGSDWTRSGASRKGDLNAE